MDTVIIETVTLVGDSVTVTEEIVYVQHVVLEEV